LSRTDSHAPSRVRLARGDLSGRPWHAAPHDDCDLPDRSAVVRHQAPGTSCVWEYCYTGVNECPCMSCHGGALARARNRAERHRDRMALNAALSAWRRGNAAAFDALVPPGRRR
jgi:hypothetical protein